MYRASQIIRINPYVQLFCSIIIAILFFLATIPLFNIKNAINSYQESLFIESGYVATMSYENTYYSNIQVLDIYEFETGSSISSLIMMVDDNLDYNGNYFVKYAGYDIHDNNLGPGELSISKELSRQGIKIGDQLTVKLNTNIFVNYTVKYVFDDFYGFSSTNILSAERLIILGFSNEIIENAHSYKFYHFANENSIFTQNIIFDKNSEINHLTNIENFIRLILVMIISTILFFVVHVFSKGFSRDIRSLRMQGYSKNQLLLYSVLDSTYRFLPIYVLAYLFIIITQLIMSNFMIETLIISILGFFISVSYQTLVNYIKVSKVV